MLKNAAAIIACCLCTASPGQVGRNPSSNPPDRRKPQAISFAAVPPQSVTSAISLAATSSSGLPVNLYPTTPAVCTISGSLLKLIAAGTCVIRANQAGNEVYAPAPMVMQSLFIDSGGSPDHFAIAKPGSILRQAYPPPPGRLSSSCPRPTIEYVSPYSWPSGGTYQVTIKGSGFTSPENTTESCPVPWFTAQTDADSSILLNVTVIDSTTAVATVTVSADGPGGVAFIQVWYPPPPGDDGPTITPGSRP